MEAVPPSGGDRRAEHGTAVPGANGQSDGGDRLRQVPHPLSGRRHRPRDRYRGRHRKRLAQHRDAREHVDSGHFPPDRNQRCSARRRRHGGELPDPDRAKTRRRSDHRRGYLDAAPDQGATRQPAHADRPSDRPFDQRQ